MIDWAQVSQLRAEIGDDGFAEVADAFLTEVADVLEDLRQDRIPPGRMEDIYHGLKGSALSLGLSDFARTCADAEIASREGQPLPDPEWLVGLFRTERAQFLSELSARSCA